MVLPLQKSIFLNYWHITFLSADKLQQVEKSILYTKVVCFLNISFYFYLKYVHRNIFTEVFKYFSKVLCAILQVLNGFSTFKKLPCVSPFFLLPKTERAVIVTMWWLKWNKQTWHFFLVLFFPALFFLFIAVVFIFGDISIFAITIMYLLQT